jgi:hypothetical protein
MAVFISLGMLFMILPMLLTPLAIAWVPIYYFVIFKKKQQSNAVAIQSNVEAVKNTDEYKRICAEIDVKNRQNKLAAEEQRKLKQAEFDEQAERRQAELDAQSQERYENSCKTYESNMIKYEAEMRAVTLEREEAVNEHNGVLIPEWTEALIIINNSLTEAQTALAEIYAEDIIPAPYRNHAAVLFLAVYMSTSQFDLKESIKRLDSESSRELQRRQISIAQAHLMVAKEQLRSLNYANWLNELQVGLMNEQNALLDESNYHQEVGNHLQAEGNALAAQGNRYLKGIRNASYASTAMQFDTWNRARKARKR